MIVAGLDVGAKRIKVVIMDNGKIIGKGMAVAGIEADEAFKGAWDEALKAAGLKRDDVKKVCGTGARLEEVSGYDEEISTVIANAKAMSVIDPSVRTIIDVGAEKAEAVKVDGNGKVLDFALNEKCAAGAGAFIEAMARALQVSIEEFSKEALKATKSIPINAQCVIFAESEVVTLIHEETPRPEICRAVCDGISDRLASMARRVTVEPKVALVGGAARIEGLQQSLKNDLQLDELVVPEEPEFVSAMGAALHAAASD